MSYKLSLSENMYYTNCVQGHLSKFLDNLQLKKQKAQP